ncbi:methyl-accepting chemotaxis protein [Rhodopseudomonas sp. BAL398]|nr:methyl-accepting chemotaxis protein [Rhodopseudomonas sp. BAL398]MDF3810259.1 methyl-accepting chemotaxis protein [Rhodopseudomonas sp. BAL398]
MNLCSLSKAQLNLAVIIVASAIALTLEAIGYRGAAMTIQAIAILSSAVALYNMMQTTRLIEQARDVCVRIAAGDFEARILAIPDNGRTGELLGAINDMIDGCDAFVREASAAMSAVHEHKYFRRILPGGLHGALLQGAGIINAATVSIEHQIESFQTRTAQLEGSVSVIVSALDSGSADMKDTAGSLQRGASTTRQRLPSVAAASERATASMRSVASATAELSSSASEVGADIDRSAQIVGRAVTRVTEAGANVDVLRKVAERINEVVKAINTIASQTNLLALNATIEAARAGESGRGFAVVAHEVKALATQTADFTAEIEAQVGEVQAAADSVGGSIAEIGAVIAEVDAITGKVHVAAEAQAQATATIARNIDQAFAVVSDIATDIHAITLDAENTERHAASTLTASTDLSAQSGHLTHEIRGFLDQARKDLVDQAHAAA